MILTPIATDFKALYIELGLGEKASGELAPLHSGCPNAEKCWKNNPKEIPASEKSERAKISHPWVGSKFQKLKLLCLGINMNDHGGFSACQDLVIDACEEMKNGAIKVRFDCDPQEYAGTLLFHRMGMYAALIAQSAGISMLLNEEGLPTHEEVVRAFDYIAYTNHIKCSPVNEERGKPTPQMWELCGDFILRKELEMLQPKILLVLGISDNQYQLINKVLDPNSTKIISTVGEVQIKQASFNGQPIKLVIAPHPAAFGGSAKKLMTDMQEALMNGVLLGGAS